MIRLAVRVRRADAERVLAELVDLAPSGVEEQDDGDVVEYAIYGAAGEVPALPALEAAVGGALVEVRTSEVADDWAERWRSFHRPVLVADRLHVRPPWAPALGREDVIETVIDPGRAFGTGGHHTTRLCLELLVGLAQERPSGPGRRGPGRGGTASRGSVLDLGCGSGVLAVAAAQLGWEPVHGLDHEQASVEATRANAAVNGVSVTAGRFDLLRDGPAPATGGGAGSGGSAHALVLANLLRPLLLRVAADGFAGGTPDRLIASGLLRHEADEVARAFTPLGLTEAHRREDGDWAALLLCRV